MTTFSNHVTGEDFAIVGGAEKGIGVHGVSKDGAGVQGNSENGPGLYGGSKTSAGVGGISEKGIGVHAVSFLADGVFGSSEKGRGVVGVATAASGAAGVEGNSISGPGVYGKSETGVGLHGKGGRLAGLFEGVEITGNLTIQGVSIQHWLQRIVTLEQKLAALLQQIAASQAKVDAIRRSRPHPPPPDVGASCQVELDLEHPAFGGIENIRIFGSGFIARETVEIVEGGQVVQTTQADGLGMYVAHRGVLKSQYGDVMHTFHAHGQTSGRTSSSAGIRL